MANRFTLLAVIALCTSIAAQREGRRRATQDPELEHFAFKVESFKAPSIEC
jgi:hypothetical protein